VRRPPACSCFSCPAGVEVTGPRKTRRFSPRFRGEPFILPLELMYEINLLEDFLQRPHQNSRRWPLVENSPSPSLTSHNSNPCKFIALMPSGISEFRFRKKAKSLSGFHFAKWEAKKINYQKIVSQRSAKKQNGVWKFEAYLVVGADGRRSLTREKSAAHPNLALPSRPLDALSAASDPEQTLAAPPGKILSPEP